jgi:AraC-like DNA-binding protein
MSVRNSTCVFQEEAGISPAEFVKVARVDWARLLLEYTDKPLQVCEFRHHAAPDCAIERPKNREADEMGNWLSARDLQPPE